MMALPSLVKATFSAPQPFSFLSSGQSGKATSFLGPVLLVLVVVVVLVLLLVVVLLVVVVALS